MRIVCEQCQTKYIVPDEKIVKSILRLTCQKCGHVITTRVDDAVKSEEASSSTLGKWHKTGSNIPSRLQQESPCWYYSINGESIGPLTEGELKDRLLSEKMAPMIDQCYVWQKSFSEWKPVLDVEPFASAILMPPPPPPPAKQDRKNDSSLPPLFSGMNASHGSKFEIGQAKSSPDLPGLKQRLQSSNGLLSERQRESLAKLAGASEHTQKVETSMLSNATDLNERTHNDEDDDSSDKTRVRGPMPFLSFQSLDAISPSIKAETVDGGKAPDLVKPFPSLSGIPALSKNKETPAKESLENADSAKVSSKPSMAAVPSAATNVKSSTVPSISSRFSNIHKDESVSKDDKLEDSKLPKPSGIPRFAGLRSMASGAAFPVISPDPAKLVTQTTKPVLNAVAELTKKTSIENLPHSQVSEPVVVDTLEDKELSSPEQSLPASADFSKAEIAQEAAKPEETEPQDGDETKNVEMGEIDLGAIDLNDEPSVADEIEQSSKAEPDVPAISLDNELDDIDLDDEASVVQAVPLLDLMEDSELPLLSKSGEKTQSSEKSQNPAIDSDSSKSELSTGQASSLDAISLDEEESPDVKHEAIKPSEESEDDAQKLMTSEEVLSVVSSSNESAVDADKKEASDEIASIDLEDASADSDSADIAGMEGLVSASDLKLDIKEEAGVAKAHASHSKLDEIETRYSDLFAASELQDKKLADESSVSEASQLIQLEHFMKAQKKETQKSGLIIAAIVAVIVLAVVGAIIGGIVLTKNQKPDVSGNTQASFNQNAGRAITSDELDEFVPNDEFEIIEVAPTPAPAAEAHHARRPKTAAPSEPSGTQNAMDTLYGQQPESTPDDKPAAPAVKQDGRANVVLQKAGDFGSTEAVQGSKYTTGATAREAFTAGLRSISVTVGECFKREAKMGNLNVEKVRLRLTVQPTGTVSDFKVLEDVPDSFNKCLEGKRDRWKFAPFTGSAVTMTQSFVRG